MSKETKYWRVTDEIASLIDKREGYSQLREILIFVPFSFKKLKKLSQEIETLHREFWCRVGELYPCLDMYALSYNRRKQSVYKTEEN